MSKRLRKAVDVGLSSKPLSPGELEELLSGFEERIRERIEEATGRRLDELDLVVTAELDSEGLRIGVDVRATGRFIAPLSYDEVLAEAIDEAAKWLEEKLRSRGASGGGEEASRAG